MAYHDSRPSAAAYRASGSAVPPDRVAASDSLECVLLRATARALGARGGSEPEQPLGVSGPCAASTEREDAQVRDATRRALTAAATTGLDAEAVAAWVVGHYTPGSRRWAAGPPYPAVVVGSPHGAAAHLAATLRAPWLPAGFEFSVRWPEGVPDDPSLALEHGAGVARRVLAANPGLSVRQIHDPVLRGRAAGTTVTLSARWRRVPRAYRAFLSSCLAPAAPVLLVSDDRRWPVFDLGGGLSFQLGSPSAGLEPEDHLSAGPDLRQALRSAGADPYRWTTPKAVLTDGLAEHGPNGSFAADLARLTGLDGRSLRPVRYSRPSALSMAVAQVIRDWLIEAGKDGDRLVIGCRRTLDPAQALRAGLVPYWCESALRSEVADAELWLAGSRPFASVDVLVEPPGRLSSVIAPIPQWRALAWFGRRRGQVDRTALRSYPYGALPARHAAVVLSGHSDDLPPAPTVPPSAAVAALAGAAATAGLRVG